MAKSKNVLMATAIAPALWGTTYLVTTEFLPPDRPLLAGTLRALPAGLILLAFTRTLPRGSWWLKALALGTLNIGAFFALLFVSAYRLPGGVSAAHPPRVEWCSPRSGAGRCRCWLSPPGSWSLAA